MDPTQEEEQSIRGDIHNEQTEDIEYLTKLWENVSRNGNNDGENSTMIPYRGTQRHRQVKGPPYPDGGSRFTSEQGMTRLLENNGRPRATTTPWRAPHGVPVGYEHPKWAISAVSACLAFFGGGLGVVCNVLAEDDIADVNESLNQFFTRSKELSVHISQRFGYMMQLVNEKLVDRIAENAHSFGAPTRHYSPPPSGRARGNHGRLSPVPTGESSHPPAKGFNENLTSPTLNPSTVSAFRSDDGNDGVFGAGRAPAREFSPGRPSAFSAPVSRGFTNTNTYTNEHQHQSQQRPPFSGNLMSPFDVSCPP
eukprot:TRINITY_DN31410_c0_g1_i1.p1 TRINITY_DN31410_c0_g1~~TRINITY_DN31410_c0_g1_i1.p1  ORF type:complete len:330 (+),score=50.47 TRINITY_DN31410_c0_g1_i1:65-991(+)